MRPVVGQPAAQLAVQVRVIFMVVAALDLPNSDLDRSAVEVQILDLVSGDLVSPRGEVDGGRRHSLFPGVVGHLHQSEKLGVRQSQPLPRSGFIMVTFTTRSAFTWPRIRANFSRLAQMRPGLGERHRVHRSGLREVAVRADQLGLRLEEERLDEPVGQVAELDVSGVPGEPGEQAAPIDEGVRGLSLGLPQIQELLHHLGGLSHRHSSLIMSRPGTSPVCYTWTARSTFWLVSLEWE
jgi:hypothetical protein